jgi:hypothetical protein
MYIMEDEQKEYGKRSRELQICFYVSPFVWSKASKVLKT